MKTEFEKIYENSFEKNDTIETYADSMLDRDGIAVYFDFLNNTVSFYGCNLTERNDWHVYTSQNRIDKECYLLRLANKKLKNCEKFENEHCCFFVATDEVGSHELVEFNFSLLFTKAKWLNHSHFVDSIDFPKDIE